MDEISMGRMELDAVSPCFNRSLGSPRKSKNDFLDLIFIHLRIIA